VFVVGRQSTAAASAAAVFATRRADRAPSAPQPAALLRRRGHRQPPTPPQPQRRAGTPRPAPARRHRRGRGHRVHHQAGGQETVRHREPDRTRPVVGHFSGRAAAATDRGRLHGRRRRRRRRGRRYPTAIPVHRAGRVPGAADGAVRVPSRGRRGCGDRVPGPPPTARRAPQPAATVAPPPPAAATAILTVRRGLLFSAAQLMRTIIYIKVYIRVSCFRKRNINIILARVGDYNNIL